MTRTEIGSTTREAAAGNRAASRHASCHPADGFGDLIHRARLSKEGQRLLQHGLIAIQGHMESDIYVD